MLATVAQQDRLIRHLAQRSPARAQELRDAGVAATTISRAVEAGLVLRIGRGLYQLPDTEPAPHAALIEVAKRAPKSVICLASALAFHEVTDLLPRKVWIAVGPKEWSPKIDYPSIRVVRLREPYLSSGVERHIVGGVELKVYSLIKTIADAFRLPKLVDRAAAISALKTALRDRKATPGEFAAAARENGAWKQLQPYLEALTADG
jgi:predicted transcriptional regulator of viral defense system